MYTFSNRLVIKKKVEKRLAIAAFFRYTGRDRDKESGFEKVYFSKWLYVQNRQKTAD